jgi:hypothetical protein
MPAPAKPKPTTPKAATEPIEFHETLTPVVPYAPVAPSLRLSDRYLRAGIYLVWIAAAILAGVSVGLLIVERRPAPVTAAPVPVAKATVKVAPAATTRTPQLLPAKPLRAPSLRRAASATSIYQAQAGNIAPMASGAVYQHAASSEALQPGFTHYGLAQGTRGTAPVAY